MNKVSVVILNYNGIKYLRQFLPSVIANSQDEGVEIVVADNSSTDSSIQFMKESYPDIRLIEFDTNSGYAGGYNAALEQVNSEYYILLNSDVEVPENWIKPVLEFLDNNRDVAAAMPKIKSYTKKSHFEYAGAAGGFIDKYGYPFCRGRVLSFVEEDNNQYNDIADIFWASGACLFVRAELFHKAGGFDTDFFAHMEEIDLCWRLWHMGHRIVIVPDSEVFHVGGGTLPINTPFKMYLNYRNNLFLLQKNLPSEKLFPVLLSRLILDGASAMVYLLKLSFGFFGAVFRAHMHFYKNLRKTHKKRKQIQKFCSQKNISTIYNHSMVFNFIIRKRRVFKEYKF
ncbi:MAG: glycosyltransferase family 2 protein [Bacteroidales bacterium]|nr:glycosyltransferase family 2 protein [Bacteroidales bacterium]MBN2819021.1 glycosyltransferase family 2 protein [Bacteroidales bacterium]